MRHDEPAGNGQTFVPNAVAKGLLGVSQSVVNRFMSGERGISFETATKFCHYLKLALR